MTTIPRAIPTPKKTPAPSPIGSPDLSRAEFLGTEQAFDWFSIPQGFCAFPSLPLHLDLSPEERSEILIFFHPDLQGLKRGIQLYLRSLPDLSQARAKLTEAWTPSTFEPLTHLGPQLCSLRHALVQTYNWFPHSIGVLDSLALCAFALNRWEEGLFHLRKSIDLCQNPAESLLILANALKTEGKEVEFRSYQEKGLRLQRRTAIRKNLSTVGEHVLWDSPEVCELVRGVIQVGANVGDEVQAFSKIGIPHQCYFEALPSAWEQLQKTLESVDHERFQVLSFPIALGNRVGQLPFFEGQHSGNSSFLDLAPSRSKSQEGNVHKRTIQVPVETLDHMVEQGKIPLENYNLLFLDVQGYEHEVIKGARKSLPCIDFIVLEVSYTEIYEGNPLSQETRSFLEGLGFQRYKEAPGHYPEQGDAIYIRKGSKVAKDLRINLYS
ncbi:MAG TPA: FkbM family methyltransferase [Planctomycetes bacterium]|nr:FkbM family methyltransferase [Planctomycetota bacterium]